MTQITVIGNLTDDPELRFTASGQAVANFNIAHTPRKLNKNTNEWEDGDTMFLPVHVWGQYAENVVESLARGNRVVVVGELGARNWQDREGNNRVTFEVNASEVAPSLRWAIAKPEKIDASKPEPTQEPTRRAPAKTATRRR